MSLPKQKMRELVFLAVYSMDMGDLSPELLMEELKVTKKNTLTAIDSAHKVFLLKDELDDVIKNTSTTFDFERIQSVERNILRLSIYEMLHEKTVPPKVSISEAIRLSKKFSTAQSTSFVNAILDNILKHAPI